MALRPSVDSNRSSVAAGRIGFFQYAAIVAQLGVLALVMRQFQIESGAYLRLVVLAFGGFAVHALLPLPFRLPFFLGLSLGAIALVLGVVNGIWLVAIGLVLIGICHLPIRFSWRVILMVVVGAALVLQRASWLPAPWPAAIWPILGSMFMFRLVVYLYDLRFEKTPPTPVRTLSYFFMLPNVCFPLFPVIDYKAFRRNYYDADAYLIYQTGVDWIVRGVMHLVLYRFVYYYLTLAPSEVHGPARPGAVPDLQLSALSARVRTVSSGRRDAVSVRIQAPRDPSSATCLPRASPTSGAGSIFTGKTSC